MRKTLQFLGGVVFLLAVAFIGLMCIPKFGDDVEKIVRTSQDVNLARLDDLAVESYFAAKNLTAVYALSNFLLRVEQTSHNRINKGREFWYMSFKAHARLAKAYERMNIKALKMEHVRLAIEDLRHWAPSAPTNEASVFQVLDKIDAEQIKQMQNRN